MRRLGTTSRSTAVRCFVGEDYPGPHEQEPVTAGRLVHHVAGDRKGSSSLTQAPERAPEFHPQHRIQINGVVGEVGFFDHSIDVAAWGAENGTEVAQVLPHCQIVIDGRGLGRATDPTTETWVPGGGAQHGDRARNNLLHTDYRPHERALAAKTTIGVSNPSCDVYRPAITPLSRGPELVRCHGTVGPMRSTIPSTGAGDLCPTPPLAARLALMPNAPSPVA